MTQTTKNEIFHHSGMKYVENKKYYVAGARSAWDTVPVGLYDTHELAIADWPDNPKCIREATQIEINNFFGIK